MAPCFPHLALQIHTPALQIHPYSTHIPPAPPCSTQTPLCIPLRSLHKYPLCSIHNPTLQTHHLLYTCTPCSTHAPPALHIHPLYTYTPSSTSLPLLYTFTLYLEIHPCSAHTTSLLYTYSIHPLVYTPCLTSGPIHIHSLHSNHPSRLGQIFSFDFLVRVLLIIQ